MSRPAAGGDVGRKEAVTAASAETNGRRAAAAAAAEDSYRRQCVDGLAAANRVTERSEEKFMRRHYLLAI